MEFYPMPLFVKLAVENMERSLHWYTNVLGFESVFELPDDDGQAVMAHIRGQKYQDIMLVSDSKSHAKRVKGQGVILNMTVDDVDSFATRANELKADIVEGPVDRPWNARELVLKDPDGYLITLSMVIDKQKTFTEVMGQPGQ